MVPALYDTTSLMKDYSHIRNAHIRTYAQACDELGIPYKLGLKTRQLYLTTKSGSNVYIYKAATPLNSQSSVILAKKKQAVHQLLDEQGISVPKQIRIKTEQDLEKFIDEIKDIVVKPADSSGGKGITVLPARKDIHNAFTHARKYSRQVLAEQYVSGENYRFLVLDGSVIAVALRTPPRIIGDGVSTLRALFNDKNTENRSQGLPKIPDSSITWDIVKTQGFTETDIVPAGTQISLRLTANLSLGGSVTDVTEDCLDEYKELAIAAAKTVGLRLAGIDIIAENIATAGRPAFVIETNGAPGMRIHYKDWKGAERKVGKKIVEQINLLPVVQETPF
ncbi:MAG: sugar-transfer associated ATP-grasp domain-containing protein [Candidatus Dojkabacteria bacterium]|nr:MAG: sugar-transfer associated ATP-grasp domain-containing protein [Candidatus Dojkabacteria bacterium]